MIIGRKKTILMINILVLISNTAVFLIGHLAGLSALSVMIAFSATGGLMTIIDMTIFMKQTGVSLTRFFRFVFIYLLLPVLAGIAIRIGLQCVMY